MIRAIQFGNAGGFGEGKRRDEYYYSQGMQRSPGGPMTGFGMTVLATSDTISGLGNIKYFADVVGTMYAVDSNGKIYKEATAGVGNFGTAVRTPGGSGRGLLGDQKGRLLYFQNTQIGMYDGATWTDNWKTGLNDVEHPADTYEDLVPFANGPAVGVIYADDTMNATAFDLPSSFSTADVCGGHLGILVGANLGYTGYIILWNPLYDRSAAPWIPVPGQVQSIERTDGGWIVVTTKQVLWTNGYSTRQLFPLLDDPLAYLQYAVAPQGTLRVNDKLFVLNQYAHEARRKSGVYVLDLQTLTFEFIPVSTLAVTSVTPLAIAASKASTQQILVGYADATLSKNYIATISATAITRAVYVSEPVGNGTGDKAAEAIILNLAPSPNRRNTSLMTFDVSVKLYDFERPLWGLETTNALAGAANQLRVNGASANVEAQVGDEVTILNGANAGQVRHITAIANEGLSNETWTLDRDLSGATASGIDVQVEPYQLIERKTFASQSTLPQLYFNCTERQRGKQFLIKVLIENANVQLVLHPSTFVYDDLGPAT
jgi:hypothetical protein